MKRIYNMIALFFLTISLVHATPQVAGFSVQNTYLQSGKIKVYDGGPTEFLANISASRAIIGSVYESVEMQVVFYIISSGAESSLKTITLTSSDFDGTYLAYYNETAGNPPGANNVVKVSIPVNVNHGRVAVKYRWKDSNGDWQPFITGVGDEYTYLNNYGYDTINLTPPPPSSEGLLMQTSDQKVYSIMDGEARHIQNMATLAGVYNYNGYIHNCNCSTLPEPIGAPIGPDTSLLIDNSNGKMYFREGTYIRHIISVAVANKYYFQIYNNNYIVGVSGLNGYTVGPPIQ
jgi:hypothetical protein